MIPLGPATICRNTSKNWNIIYILSYRPVTMVIMGGSKPISTLTWLHWILCFSVISLFPAPFLMIIPTDLQTVGLVGAITASGLPVLDINDLASDQALGVTMPSFTIDENHNRSSVRDRLISVEQNGSGNLKILVDTLATKILLCNNSAGIPTAYGVEIAPGAALPVASNFNGKSVLKTQSITVRHEVIVSAGTFQSPQLVSRHTSTNIRPLKHVFIVDGKHSNEPYQPFLISPAFWHRE